MKFKVAWRDENTDRNPQTSWILHGVADQLLREGRDRGGHRG